MSAAPIATTTSGQLRGQRLDDAVLAFKGIPYAAPPVGDLRFRPPQPPTPWDGVREATTLPPSCPQPQQRPAGWTQETSEDEDCLYLNVWTPAVDDEQRRPVMVWFHGGGYAIGSGSWPLYDGAALTRRGDVVVITVNHRLGPLGYLHLGDLLPDDPTLAASGNAGMLDLVAVLEWVRDNARAFGGDPGNVTIFGESGGGAKVSTLLAMPAARGLFHRAIVQSGPGVRVGSTRGATKGAQALLDHLGLDDPKQLWDVPAADLVAAGTASGSRMGFRPVLDGTAVAAHPAEALADGTAADVPLLIGCNRDEGASGLPKELDEAGLRARLARTHGEEHVDEILATYAELFPGATPLDVLSFTLTDARMRHGSIVLADAKAKGTASPTFQYFFTYELGGRAGHGYEIAFAFDNLGRGATPASGTRQALADAMSEAWLAFARDGDPNHPGLPKWPAWTLTERPTMVFGPESHVVDDPSGAARELWSRLLGRPTG
jgi:para-nitrobenzyl esterase